MKEIRYAFQLSKTKIFIVRYDTVGSNEHPYFATGAGEFYNNKMGCKIGGQAQKTVLPPFPEAYDFFLKWNSEHLHVLTEDKYAEMVKDLEVLKNRYNYMCREGEEARRPFGFNTLAEWTKQKPKKAA